MRPPFPTWSHTRFKNNGHQKTFRHLDIRNCSLLQFGLHARFKPRVRARSTSANLMRCSGLKSSTIFKFPHTKFFHESHFNNHTSRNHRSAHCGVVQRHCTSPINCNTGSHAHYASDRLSEGDNRLDLGEGQGFIGEGIRPTQCEYRMGRPISRGCSGSGSIKCRCRGYHQRQFNILHVVNCK